MAADNAGADKSFELFELVTAAALGLAAIGVAVAGVQGGQWNGRQSQAFAEANSITTQASKSYSEGVSDMNSDYAIIGQAKQKILEGIDAANNADKVRSYRIASYYLTRQLSVTAYAALKLPERDEDGNFLAADAAKPAAASRSKFAQVAAQTEEGVEAQLAEVLPETALINVLGSELQDDDTYESTMFAEGNELFAKADKRFEDGRKANDAGDEFQLAGLYYTFALFFGGLALVFKTRIRWGFCSAGIAALVVSTAYMATRTWP
jgi:hypothetical protein